MFKITKEAEAYVADLFAQQDGDELGLKIEIEKPGTPGAAVAFNFCFTKDLPKTFELFTYDGFNAFISKENFIYLGESSVALKDEGSGKKLTITAPNAKGKEPDKDDPLSERIKYMIAAEVNPSLASHGGFVELVEITSEMDIVLNFGGGCQGCSGVKVTLKNGVEAQMKSMFPEIRHILDVTDHSVKENAYM
jgi:Fe/S biogenesis protein NfuA